MFGICSIVWESVDILLALHRANRSKANDEKKQQEDSLQITLLYAHTAINIGLFPPLFFFSALYYTDVVSTWYVLKGYKHFLQSQQPESSSLGSIAWAVFIGIAALFFRQTNIFWVAVFPAGLAVLNALKHDQDSRHAAEAPDLLKIANDSWQSSVLYDCPVDIAGLEGIVCSRRSSVHLPHPSSPFMTPLICTVPNNSVRRLFCCNNFRYFGSS